jgi:protease I
MKPHMSNSFKNIFHSILTVSLFITSFNIYGGDMLKNKKAVFIIASDKFRDEEYQKPKAILEREGIQVTTASSTLNEVTGMLGAKAKPTINFKDIKVADYDLIVFIGGQGASEYWDNPTAHEIARKTVENEKVLGAICIAPVTLANARVLEGKKATSWPDVADKLKIKGVKYSTKKVEVDGNIITGNGPEAADEFGKALVKALQ